MEGRAASCLRIPSSAGDHPKAGAPLPPASASANSVVGGGKGENTSVNERVEIAVEE